jgi:hypothetical protein
MEETMTRRRPFPGTEGKQQQVAEAAGNVAVLIRSFEARFFPKTELLPGIRRC